LVESGGEKGDRVVLFLNKSLLFVVAHLSLQKIGDIAVPLNPGFKPSEMAYLLGDADPKLILSDPEKASSRLEMPEKDYICRRNSEEYDEKSPQRRH
jgi:malonyl-CoA/methylmalonyl-CoA synthetase